MLDKLLLDRVRAVAPINPAPGSWHYQATYRGEFPPPHRELTDADLDRALRHEWWIGSRACVDASGTAVTDRLAFDLDCDDEGELPDPDDRYRRLREIMGHDRTPLVYGTPSGRGLRVVYPIPQCPLSSVIVGAGRGFVADVLRGAGLEVRAGSIELFPQATHVDRLMLCRRMPLLDPESLLPVGERPIGDRFDERALTSGLEHVEAWHAAIEFSLMDHFAELHRVTIEHGAGPEAVGGCWRGAVYAPEGEEPLLSAGSDRGVEVGKSLIAVVREGLCEPHTRYWAEFRDGLHRPA